jgi:hypothetical protein
MAVLAATLIAAGFAATGCSSSGSPATTAGTSAPAPATTAPVSAPAGSVTAPPSAPTPGKAPQAIRPRLAPNPADGQKIIVSDVSLVARAVVPSISVYATATATTANWTLKNFGGGNGEIGIHGTNEPASLGKNVSHGCIRMSNTNITKLAGMLPLGVPVQIAN